MSLRAEMLRSFLEGSSFTAGLAYNGAEVADYDRVPIDGWQITGTVARARVTWQFNRAVTFNQVVLYEGDQAREHIPLAGVWQAPAPSSHTEDIELSIN